MKDRKVELLAPAGNFACFRAAVNAGADAVYLGGGQFGARAYAGNFTTEEIIEALQAAHIFGRKIYLTVNTLVKESELRELIPYMAPLCDAGLDGAIVQDIGVLVKLREAFPHLALHASTQMSITGSYGAAYMKRLGVCRVVPARELSLAEVKDIKDKTGLETECFVHGSMCYAYSGQCLFSSLLGGRSGNRGRCAGPCRLPYTDERGRTLYPLSLRDLCTLSALPGLINAGIDSFKIEGRMKSPEYVAGVTAMYRKYMDMYLANPQRPYKVLPEDEQTLRGLYIRSGLCGGYYQRHNGKSMITLKEPGYSGCSQEVLDRIRERFIDRNIQLQVSGYVRIYAGEQALLTLSCKEASVTAHVTAQGGIVSAAVNRPLDKAEITKRLCRLGDTCFVLTDLTVDTDGGAFMPVKALNELRRTACHKLVEKLSQMRKPALRKGSAPLAVPVFKTEAPNGAKNKLTALVTTAGQLSVINAFDEITEICVDSGLFLNGFSPEQILNPGKRYILVMPHIFRKRSYRYRAVYERLLGNGFFKGVLVRNFEELEWLREEGYAGAVYADHTIYIWNNAALAFCSGQFDQITLPLELNRKELDRLDAEGHAVCLVLYGYIPLMYSANCVRNTLEKCIKGGGEGNTAYHLTDRYHNIFPVRTDCTHCYNTIYNTVPLSLHGQLSSIFRKGYNTLRLDFSIEDEIQTRAVARYYRDAFDNPDMMAGVPFRDFTNGHYKRGVE